MIHERKLLVQRPQCQISRCSCGVYHVSTGSVTLRMAQPQLEDLLRALEVVLVSDREHEMGEADDDPPIH